MKQFPFYNVTVKISVTGEPKLENTIFYGTLLREKLLENEVLAPILEELEASIDEN